MIRQRVALRRIGSTRLLPRRPGRGWGRLPRLAGSPASSSARCGRRGARVVPNHDSQWDPSQSARRSWSAVRKRRSLRFLARASLWKIPGLGAVLYGMGQIPIERGTGDVRALGPPPRHSATGRRSACSRRAASRAASALRARTGISRLGHECPQARVVLCTVAGPTDYVRFPKRPRVSVELFEPAGGQPATGEDPQRWRRDCSLSCANGCRRPRRAGGRPRLGPRTL